MVKKVAPYSRRELRRLRREWVGRNAQLLALMMLVLVGLIVFSAVVLLASFPRGGYLFYVLGALHVGLVATVLHLAQTTFLAHEREAIWQLRGAWGEENTRTELERAKRKKLIWGWVDSVTVQGGDIDHLVVTRSGGLLAIDSKWRNQPDLDDNVDMAHRAERARRRAEGVVSSVLPRERRGRRAAGRSVSVRAVVVLWGAVQHQVPEGYELDGVTFVGGRRMVDWLAQHEGNTVDAAAAKDLLRRIEDFRALASA